MMQSLMMTLL